MSTHPRPYRGKRTLDLIIVAMVALPATILGMICACAVRLSSRGPVLFLQERVGYEGEPFVVMKFRTMFDGDNPIIVSADRVTRVGRLLRRTSLDELPQLINVLKGEMSVVGPRPTLAYQVERWTDEQRGRLAVRPGLTGLAQVSGRNNLSWAQRIELDLTYVASQSVMTDCLILARTATALFGSDGAGTTAADDPIAQVPEESVA